MNLGQQTKDSRKVTNSRKKGINVLMNRSVCFLLFLGSLEWSGSLLAALEVETSENAGSCLTLVHTLRTRWFDVRQHMQPVSGSISMPANEDFRCLPRSAVRSALEKRLPTSANIKCYNPIGSKGLGVCCDNPLTACAQLNPGLFPELMDENWKKYEPPRSNWVRPPSDADQWNSND